MTEAAGSPRTLTRAAGDGQVDLGHLEHPRGELGDAGPRTARAAACTALPATTVVRDAQEPMPNGCRSVSPLTTLHRLQVDAERVGGDLG